MAIYFRRYMSMCVFVRVYKNDNSLVNWLFFYLIFLFVDLWSKRAHCEQMSPFRKKKIVENYKNES